MGIVLFDRRYTSLGGGEGEFSVGLDSRYMEGGGQGNLGRNWVICLHMVSM